MRKTLLLLPLAFLAFLFAPGPVLAIDDIPPGVTNWIQGVQEFHTSGGFQNEGVLLLESIDDSFGVTFVVTNGVVTNLPAGTIQVSGGAGGGRALSADIINEGTFTASYGVNLSRDFGFFDQFNTFNLAFAQVALMEGFAQTFNQNDGIFTTDGFIRFSNGTFNYRGGTITGFSGIIYMVNESLFIAPTATNACHFQMNGHNCRFEGDLVLGQTLVLLAGYLGPDSIVTAQRSINNGGSIRLFAANSGAATLNVTSGVLTNSVTGVISSEVGGGGARKIAGPFVNEGSINVIQPLTVEANRGPFIDNGTVNIAVGSRLSVSGNYTRLGSSLTRVVLTQSDATSGHSPITVTGQADLDGEVSVSFPGGFTPLATNKFWLIQAQSISGVFTKATLPPPRNGFTWDLIYEPNGVRLGLINTNDAPIYEIELLPPNQVRFTFSGPPPGQDGFVLDTTTNLIDWVSIQTNSPFTGIIQIDTDASQLDKRFFRVLKLP